MAYFKLDLLTPRYENVMRYLLTNITLYELKQSNYNYSYNEKFSIHNNAQKDLSFNMDRYIIYNDLRMENPFINALHVGTQLLLTDKYQQQHIMTVKDIKFNIKSANIIYTYICEDSFHYQLTHQQTTYSIINDPTTVDFIGAKTLNYWAQKIKKDCFISYHFIPFDKSLYKLTPTVQPVDNLDSNNIIKDKISTFINTDYIVKQIIKPAYTDDFFKQTVSFASSATNPLAMLISLAQELDCQIATYEYIDTHGQLFNYFWLEPIKKNNPTGLKYSPDIDLQNFNLEYSGDNFATVLNVVPRQNNDEIISMFPEIPSIFLSLFTSEQWDTSRYTDSMFLDFVDGDLYEWATASDTYNITLIDQSALTQIYACKIDTTNRVFKTYYPFIRFDYNKQYSILGTTTSRDVNFVCFVPQINPSYKIKLINDNEVLPTIEDKNFHYIQYQNQYYKWIDTKYVLINVSEIISYNIVKDQGEIPFHLICHDQPWYIGYQYDSVDLIPPSAAHLYIKNYRHISDEEKLFATIADKCPWLENRLIDLNYLINNKIISPYAREQLLDLLQNDLRKVNGHLLATSAAYFTALHKQTQTIANIVKEIDHLSAVMYADIITPYTASATPLTYDTLEKAYNELYALNSTDDKTALFGYNKILNDYLNKDFKAEQRFLHAIKDFTDFFNDINPWTLNNNQIIQNTLTIIQDNIDTSISYSFKPNIEFKTIYQEEIDKEIIPTLLTQNKFNTDIYQFRDGNYYKLPIPLVTSAKYYIPALQKDTLVQCQEQEYNPNKEYFITIEKYNSIFGDITSDKIIEVQKDTSYVLLTKNEIRQLVLQKDPNKYYSRIKNYYIPFDWIRYSTSISAFKGIEPKIINVANEAIGNYSQDDFWPIYINNLDVDTLYYYGPIYTKFSKENQDYFERCNDKGYSKSEYDIKNQADNKDPHFSIGQDPNTYNMFQSIPYVHNLPVAAKAALTSWNFDAYIELTTKQKESFPYYALVKNPDQVKHARNLRIAGNSMTALWWTGIGALAALGVWASYGILNAKSKLEENCCWIQQYMPYRIFEPTITKINDGLKFTHEVVDEQNAWNGTYAIFARSATSADDCAKYTNIAYQQSNAIFTPSPEDTNLSTEQLKQAWQNWWLQNRYYFNYYGLIAATYSLSYDINRDVIDLDTLPLLINNKYNTQYNLWLQNPGFYSILTKDQLINRDDQYYCLVLGYQGDKEDKWTFFKDNQWPSFNKWDITNCPLRFNAVQYSNIIHNALNPLDLNIIPNDKWKNNTIKLAWYFTTINSQDSHYNSIFKNIVFEQEIEGPLQKIYFLILRYEPYEYATITTEPTTHINWDNYKLNYKDCDTHNIYDCQTDLRIDLLNNFNPSQFQDIDKQYEIWTRQLIDDNFLETTDFSSDNQSYYYYDSDGVYHRTYTMQQIHARLKDHVIPLYYQPQDRYESIDLQHNTKKGTFHVPLYKHYILTSQEEVQEEIINLGTYILNFDTVIPQNDIYTFNLHDETGQEFKLQVHYQTPRKLETIKPMSNGSFWYKFHNHAEWHSIFTQCMMIETQLTSAWERAVRASKGCQFFLPDSWLPKENETDNQFFSEIINVLDNDNVQLSSKFLPKVEIYSAEYQNREQTILPNYLLHFNETEVIDSEEIEPTIRLLTINNSVFKDSSIVLDNLCHDLKISLSALSFEEQGTTTYYYTTSGGTTWSKLPLQMQNKSTQYDLLSGWNGIAFQLIKMRYKNAEIPEYERYQQDKRDLWTKIYKQYPNILIEHDYKNEHALTSKELFDAAQLYFEDQKHPEERYTLSLIDVQSLQGYHGQPLQIGDAIQLDADAIYNGYDDLYHSLNKFLFITDISYDLRKDDNISITVNTVKYQEKLLQQLVSLIR